MKKKFTLSATLLLIFTFLLEKDLIAQSDFRIPAMTRVKLELMISDLTVDSLKPIILMNFFVKNDLYLNGDQIIFAGTLAEGQIAHAEQTDEDCFNIEVKPLSTFAANGQLVHFLPTSHFLKIGKCLQIRHFDPPEMTIIARTLNPGRNMN